MVELLGLHSKSDNLYIVVIYRQPNDTHSGNKSGPTELKTALSRLKQNLDNLPTPTPNLVICGDFNLPHYNWSSNEPTQGASSEEKEMLHGLSDLCNEYFLKQNSNIPKHSARNTLDLLLTNNQYILSIASHACKLPEPSQTITSSKYSLPSKHVVKRAKVKPDFNSNLDKYNFFSNDINWKEMNSKIANNA